MPGQGGISAVYSAYDPNLRRNVAIKLIHTFLSIDPNFIIRFKEVAAAVARLRHTNIVQVHDFNIYNVPLYVVYLAGETLQVRLKRLKNAGRTMGFGIMGERLREITMSFPSSYHIIPDYAVGVDQHSTKINFLKNTDWLDEKYLPLLQLGQEFRAELASSARVPTVAIFGYGIKNRFKNLGHPKRSRKAAECGLFL